jgi:ribosomal protein S18 acetylase RimI-like enzyme
MDATIRPAEPTDAATVEAVAAAAWAHDYPDVLNRDRPGEAARDWYDSDRMARDIEDPAYVVLLAERDDETVGFVQAFGPSSDTRTEETEGSILRLYVHPGARGEGVGRALLEAARTELFDRGSERVRAMTLAANEAGRAFYTACGLEATDEVAETVIDGERYDEVVFVDDRRS